MNIINSYTTGVSKLMNNIITTDDIHYSVHMEDSVEEKE